MPVTEKKTAKVHKYPVASTVCASVHEIGCPYLVPSYQHLKMYFNLGEANGLNIVKYCPVISLSTSVFVLCRKKTAKVHKYPVASTWCVSLSMNLVVLTWFPLIYT